LNCTWLQVLLGGGQDASQVTTTASKAGGFESRFFHKVWQLEEASSEGRSPRPCLSSAFKMMAK
jgi:hypothetical protein